MSSLPVPSTAKQYSDEMKQWGTASFNHWFGISTSNLKSSGIYQYGDPARLPKTRQQQPVQPQILSLIVFTLNDDYPVDPKPILDAATAEMSAHGSKAVGENGLYNDVVYTGVGKHRLIFGPIRFSRARRRCCFFRHS
jgi:hypothetical protein